MNLLLAHNAHTFRYQLKPLTVVLKSNKCTKFDCIVRICIYFIIIHREHKFTANTNPYAFADMWPSARVRLRVSLDAKRMKTQSLYYSYTM